MLNSVIRFSLNHRFLVVAACVCLMIFGGWRMLQLPIDVFPNLNRPRVVVMTETPGLAPEEVETLITVPLETSLNGAPGVRDVRTQSGVGLSVAYVEFDWGTDIRVDRQIVRERLEMAAEKLPRGATPHLAPISSIMGQINIVGIYSEQTDENYLFDLPEEFSKTLETGEVTEGIFDVFTQQAIELSEQTRIEADRPGARWYLVDPTNEHSFALVADGNKVRVHHGTSPMELRVLSDWVIGQRLRTIKGVSQVFVMGGGRKQFQVLVDPSKLIHYGVTLHEVKEAVSESNQNSTGGYLDDQGPNEYVVRVLGRVGSAADLEKVVIKYSEGSAISLNQVAKVIEAPQVKRGDSSAFVRGEDGEFTGGSAVVLTINKQPDADTRKVTEEITEALLGLKDSLPKDVVVAPELYQQSSFIDRAIENVIEALRDGGLLVVVILFLFLLNFRTTFITLTAIPLSIVITSLIFMGFDLSINTMTLGGLAVAIGELVDDAIVDVENIYRRLKENKSLENPRSPLRVVFDASLEVRNSIVFGTMIVVLVFVPLFFMGGMEGRLFTPLSIAYIVSLVASLVVSLTLTPVLSYWLLAREDIWPWVSAMLSAILAFAVAYLISPWFGGLSLPVMLAITGLLTIPLWFLITWAESLQGEHRDGPLLRGFKLLAGVTIRLSLKAPAIVLGLALVCVCIAGVALSQLENNFLPPFNEGSVQINVILPPGASLKKSNEISAIVEERLKEIPDIKAFVRKTGRAELDEHAEGVNTSEYVATLDPASERTREEILKEIRDTLKDVPGIVTSVEQPLAHLISHMMSGVKADVAIKLYGDDLDLLRRNAEQIKVAVAEVEGVEDLQVEPQVLIPQLRIEIDGDRLRSYGLTRASINEFVETAMNGEVVSQVLTGQRTFDLIVRMDEPYRENLDAVRRLTIKLPDGGETTLDTVADIYPAAGPNTINRENVRRRIVVQCNTSGRGLVDVVEDIQRKVDPIEANLPTGYFVEYSGQFESQQSASQAILIMFGISMLGMLLLLYLLFRSWNLALQVMVALPMAFIGSVAALIITDQTLTIASKVGFISLCGIASRNGILLITHYLHLVRHEGEDWTPNMIVRAGQERLAPVLMTALTSGIGLAPLALAAGEPGKEILYPVATVIIGGLISSTLLEFLVRPALFWTFGRGAGRKLTETSEEDESEILKEND